MKLFVWKNLEQVSHHYHSDGGLMIIANSLDRAKELAVIENGDAKNYEEDGPAIVVNSNPDHVFELAYDTEERVIVFPNAGCC